MQIDRIRRDASPAHKENDFDPEDEELRTLFCANLSENVTDELLYELFIQSGPVESVRIPRDKDNRPRGFGFVTFVHSVSVPYAIDLYSGVRLFNRDLILRFRNSNNAGSRNQTPTGRPRNDNSNFNSPRDDSPRSRPSRYDDNDRQMQHYTHSPPDNNSLRAGHGGGSSNRFDSNMRPAHSFGQSDKQKNFQNPFNINDLTQLGEKFLFKPLEDAVATMMRGNLNENEMSPPPGKSSRSNRQHNQNNPYYNKRSQQNSSRGKNSGRHGDWDRPSSNQRQNQRRHR